MIRDLAAIACGVAEIAVGVTKHVLGHEEPEREPMELSSIGMGSASDGSSEGSESSGGSRQTTLSEYGF